MCEFSTIKPTISQTPSFFSDNVSETEWDCPRETYGAANHCIFHLTSEEREREGATVEAIQESIVSEVNELDRWTDTIELIGARLPELSLKREQLHGIQDVTIDLTVANISGDVSLDGFSGDCSFLFAFAQIFGSVSLVNADIAGTFDCTNMISKKEFRTTGVTIGADLVLDSALLLGTLNLEDAIVEGSVSARKSFIQKGVIGTPIVSGDLRFDDAVLGGYRRSSHAAEVDGEVAGNCSFEYACIGVGAAEQFGLEEVVIGGDLDFSSCICFPQINARGIEVGGSLTAENHRFQAGIQLAGGTISGDCTVTQTSGNQQRAVGRSWIDGVTPAGCYQFEDLTVNGKFEFAISRHWRPDGLVSLYDAEIASGRLAQSMDGPMVYDLSQASIGDTVLESADGVKPFEQAVINETDFTAFDFQAHHDALTEVDHRLDVGLKKHEQRSKAARSLHALDERVNRGFARQFLYTMMRIDGFRDAVASNADLEEILGTVLTQDGYERAKSLSPTQKTGYTFFAADELKFDVGIDGDEFQSDSEVPFLSGQVLAMARDLESYLGSSQQDLQVTSLKSPYFQSLANRLSEKGWTAENITSIADSTDAMPPQFAVGTAVPLIIGICRIAERYRSGPGLHQFEESEGTAFLSRSSESLYDSFGEQLVLELLNRNRHQTPKLEEVIDTVTETITDSEGLTDEEATSLAAPFHDSMLRVPLNRIIEVVPRFPPELRSEQLKDHPAFELARLEEAALEAYRRLDAEYQPSDQRTETTYLMAKNAASEFGNNLAASEFFIRECRARRDRHYAQLSTDTSIRDQIQIGRKFVGNWLLDKVTGYGERPENVILTSIGVILSFSLLYHFLLPTPAYGGSIGNLVLSLESFVTLVHNGGYLVEDPSIRLLTELEGFIGVFLVALFVFTLTRSVHR